MAHLWYDIINGKTSKRLTYNSKTGVVEVQPKTSDNEDQAWAVIPIFCTNNLFKIQHIKSLMYLQIRNDENVTCVQNFYHNYTTIHLTNGIATSTEIINPKINPKLKMEPQGEGNKVVAALESDCAWVIKDRTKVTGIVSVGFWYSINTTNDGKRLVVNNSDLTTETSNENNSKQLWNLIPMPGKTNTYKIQHTDTLYFLAIMEDGSVNLTKSYSNNTTNMHLRYGVSGNTIIENQDLKSTKKLSVNGEGRVTGVQGDNFQRWAFDLKPCNGIK